MSESKHTPDGGPAFPVAVPMEFQFAQAGMTLRDWFAGQALAGLMSDGRTRSYYQWSEFAEDAYAVADAMLVGRSEVR